MAMRVELHVEAPTRYVGDLRCRHEVEKSAPHNVVPVDSESRSDRAKQCLLRLRAAGEYLP